MKRIVWGSVPVIIAAGLIWASVGQASFGGDSAFLSKVFARRVTASSGVLCTGECVVLTTGDFRLCPLNAGPQASYAACLTALSAACVTTCTSNP